MEKRYDLEDRTLEFSKRMIKMCRALPKNSINFNLLNQASRSGTSIGANYREANETITKKDFISKIVICLKECRETIYWLELIMEANPELKEKMTSLLQENRELAKIFAKILENSR